ncbi:AraC family transcriptional regulator [Paraburkholderia humisilvae]|uniref:HTH-type transcriptional activator RhaS n=1 Tax=Paraburkholderia humisilvae TaxID=627669 RepID=A0A6J5DCT6_9BURK|nr:AraC family transcriptional regulator [Paraburkholderia humisilvae]CAB3751753.1 HTH-type transcriptional activator RhaS [Paraburkholderia humisilvae]
MDTGFDEKSWDGAPVGRHAWINTISMHGMLCRLDAYRSGASAFNTARAGQTDIMNGDFAWQSVSPITHRDTPRWNGEHLFVKVVKSGVMSVEQRGQTTRFGPGHIAVIDPLHTFNESFCEPTRLTILRIPKSALRERGLRYRFPMACCPDPASPDVAAVREFVLHLGSQTGKASDALLVRLGDQCLDLMDVLVNNRHGAANGRASAATVLRAKQLIARRIGDPELSVIRIAAELNISISCLTRALKASGVSPMRYAWSMRLEHATRLLAGAPQGAIQEVAYQCGFASAAHFSRAFKERYGMTPREYAAHQRTAHGDAPEPMQDAQRTETA